RQQTSSRDYVISEGTTETNRDYSTFREAISKNDSLWEEILPWDYEIRFTPGGGLAADVHDPSVIYTVPFELWNIGSDTPDDNSDDYRMIPRLYDADGDSIFSLYHLYDSIFLERYYYSTDWINWMRPADISPGDAGYRQAESRMLAGTYQGNNEQEVMARMAILGNGRTAPEEGTVFRIITRKPPQDGDRFRFTSPQPASDIAYGYPRVFRLYPNFPNPFNNTTTIRFETPVNIKVKINIYNVLGQEIRSYTLFPQERDIQTVVWDGRNQSGQPVSSGIYIYRIQAEEFSASHKMILIR
ncbi:MAG: T9SS type A sorting domain-containing protein, partial [Calditrichaeota bacterium]|nr:T9SS type A sorting domain-containing protein [Calditrichota bacterium]